MAFARALGVIQSVGRGAGITEQSELYDRGQTFSINGNNYRVESFIAKGGYGTVFLASNSKGKQVAVKILLCHDATSIKDTENEIDMMKKLQHENIIQMFDASNESRSSNRSVKEYKISMEYCKFSIADVLLKYKEVAVDFVIRIIYFTTRALVYMHSDGVTHRDIKAENLLINGNAKLKLCDFGSATSKSIEMAPLSNSARLAIQEEVFQYTTPITRSPEVCDVYSNWPIGKQQDNWAMGCLIYFVCFGEHPFDGSPLAIINGKYKKPPPVQMNQLSAFADLISKCLTPNPEERITAQKIEEYMKLAMQKQPKLAAKTDFSDILDLMNVAPPPAEQGLDSQAAKGFFGMQDKLFSNLSSLKNTVVQQTNKMGWGLDTPVSARSTSSQPASSPKMTPKTPRAQQQERPAPPRSPNPPPRPQPTQPAPAAVSFTAEWPSDNGNSATSNDWGDFNQAPKTVLNKKEVFDPFAETTSHNLAAKHSEDLLSLQSWPGTGVDHKPEVRSQSSKELFDFDDLMLRHTTPSTGSSQSVLQPTRQTENKNLTKVETSSSKNEIGSSSSSASLDDMVSNMMKMSTKK